MVTMMKKGIDLMNLRENVKQKGVYVAFFILFFCIFYNIPLVHDSWAGQVYNQSGNFFTWVISRLSGYFTLNGRIIAQIFVGFFERNKLMLDVANAFFMTALVYMMQKATNKKTNFFSAIFAVLLLLLVSNNIRVEVYFYATMIYVVPVMLFFAFLWYAQIYREQKWGTGRIRFFVLCILGILNSGWIEHSAFAFVFVIGICWLKDVIKKRKINVRYTFFELLNGVTFLIMVLSPGLKKQRQFAVGSEEKWRLIAANIAKIVQAIVFDHKFLMLMLILVCIFTIKQKVNKNLMGCLYQWILIIYAILFIINLLGMNVGIKLPQFMEMNCLQENIWGTISVCIGIGLIVLLFIALIWGNEKNRLYFVYWVGVFSVLPIIVTPNFGYRICFFSLILITYLILDLFLSLKIEKKSIKIGIKSVVICALLVQIDMYSVLVANIADIQKERESRIELAKNKQRLGEWDYEQTLILPTFTQQQLYMGASPEPYYDYIHYSAFLSYYGLNGRTLVLFSDGSDELRTRIDDNNIYFSIFPDNENSESNTYNYCIMKDGQVIWNSGQTQENSFTTECPDESGNYYFKCDMIDDQGEIKEVYSARTLNN